MKRFDFFKEKIIVIGFSLLGMMSIEIFLLAYPIGLGMRIYIGVVPIVLLFLALLIECEKKKRFYDLLVQRMNELEDKYLIAEVICEPDFMEGKILKEILQETGKSMLENVNHYKYLRGRL